MSISKAKIQVARKHLLKDGVMAQIMDDVGPFELRIQRDRFQMLVRSILSQQISVAAARTIRQRLEALFSPDKISAAQLAQCDLEQLRSVGISKQKGTYLLDLSSKVEDGSLELRQIGRRTDRQIIDRLVQVKGIGVWTAQMFLIFALGRMDVFPADDLGVQRAIQYRYGYSEKPNSNQLDSVSKGWRPFRTVASWYCWRSLELDRSQNS